MDDESPPPGKKISFKSTFTTILVFSPEETIKNKCINVYSLINYINFKLIWRSQTKETINKSVCETRIEFVERNACILFNILLGS